MATDSPARVGGSSDVDEQALTTAGRFGRWREPLREDMESVFGSDTAARSNFEVLTFYPGLHAKWMRRVAHALWRRGHLTITRLVSHASRFFTGVDIHPGANIGRLFFIDHGAGVVIGETSEIGDNVLMYQGTVLGGTTWDRTKRHPTIGDGVVLGSHSVVLGNVTVGDGAKVGSGSIVVEPVPAGATVVGVPGRIVRMNGRELAQQPRDIPDHARLPDPVVETLRCLVDRVDLLEQQIRDLTQMTPVDWGQGATLDCTWIPTTSGTERAL